MKKKDTQKLNNALLEDIEVPDSVLDAARAEMANNFTEEASSPAPLRKSRARSNSGGNTIAVNKKVIAISCCASFAICLVIVIIILAYSPLFTRSNANDNIKYYNIADLEKEQITSLEQYNKENNTEYIDVNLGGVVTYAFTDGEETVLFTQEFTYNQTEYIWYIVTNENYSFDVLLEFEETYDTTEVSGYIVFCGDDDNPYTKLYDSGNAYYLTGGTDRQTLIEILNIIL